LQKQQSVLDIACGKGRHSLTLTQLGFTVLGIDLSSNSIQHAQQYASNTLQFAVHDMRHVLCANYYHAAFNLFTSFGYFKTTQHNKLAAKCISAAIKPNGYLVVDFLNVDTALQNIKNKPQETVIENDITFNITRFFANNKICKSIGVFKNNIQVQAHTEEVSAFTLQDFINFFEPNGMQLQNTFGNYNLDAYHAANSPRLIMVFKKNSV
jgi:cyclopropane fatty-acyl-phospholipid synthase-like methyltransferase